MKLHIRRSFSLLLALSACALAHSQNQVLIKFADGTSPAQASAALASVGARINQDLPQIGVKVLDLPVRADPEAVADALAHRPGVEFAEPDRYVQMAQLAPNDPWYANWQPQLRAINAPVAWSTTTGSTGLIVAVIGSGVYGAHEDLVAKMVPGWNFYDNNTDTMDIANHDTCVAGIIGASTNNGIGVAAVAWGVKLMPLRVTDLSGNATYSTIAAAINYSADHGVKVANANFWGTETSSAIFSAAHYLAGKGGLLVVPAGNTGATLGTADNPEVVMVSAVDGSNTIYSWSCRGNPVDVCAPGTSYAPISGGGYGGFSGTCCSSAMTAGVVALIMSANPSLSPSQVVTILKQTAKDLGPAGWDGNYGSGIVDSGAAVQAAIGSGGGDTTPPSVGFSQPGNGVTLQGTFNLVAQASDNVGVTSLTISIDGVQVASSASGSCSDSWNTAGVSNGYHTLMAVAKDAANNTSSSTITVDVENLIDTTPPSITITSPTGGSVSSVVTVTVNATDNVGVSKVELYVDGKLTATATGAPFSTSWNARKAARGNHTLQTKAYDQANNSAWSQVVTVTR